MRGLPQAVSGRFLLLGKIGLVLAALVFLGGFDYVRVHAINVYEDVTFAVSPSAALAEKYGERHFDARIPEMYDIDRAEHFYREMEKIDTNYPYLYHQLARMQFLKGHFNTAMIYINKQIELHKDASNSYYVRGLIEGYNGDYDAAVSDYGYYLKVDPNNWATANDYAWVLLKAKRAKDAAKVTEDALKIHPGNAWLLATRAIALFEIKDLNGALSAAKEAQVAASKITEDQWLVAYPGNDPQSARAGITTHQRSIEDNIHKIEAAIASSTVQSR